MWISLRILDLGLVYGNSIRRSINGKWLIWMYSINIQRTTSLKENI